MAFAALDLAGTILVIPAVAAVIIALLPGYRLKARTNILANLASLVVALLLIMNGQRGSGQYLLVDDFNVAFVALNSFIGFTAAVFSAGYIAHELETGRLNRGYLQFYHPLYQIMMLGLNLAFLSNNIVLMWVAVELATLATVLMVGIYRTPQALEAAWKYFILGSVGIALALFGTILVYIAAQPVIGPGQNPLAWTVLMQYATAFDPALLNVAFIFLLLGYGTKVGLVPMHAWLPAAHGEGPTPISAVLSGLLLNLALYALLRFKMLFAVNQGTIAQGPLMITLGLASAIFGAFMLYRRRDIKRFLAYSSIEHMGVIVFAFGIGGPLANFAGLLHMAMHSLGKSAIFYGVGHAAQIKGTQQIVDIRGLTGSHPGLGWGLVVGLLAIAGLPPMGIFMSEFLLLGSTFAIAPWLALALVFGLLVAFGALIRQLARIAFGNPVGNLKPLRGRLAFLPMYAHLALVLIAGIYLPAPLVSWFQHVAGMLG